MTARPRSPAAEAFRALCTNVRFSSINRPLRTLLVTSPSFAEGKSIAVTNLAVAMAQAGLSVLAVDADLRRPQLHQLFDLDPREGVTAERLWWGLSGSLLEGRTNLLKTLVVIFCRRVLQNPISASGDASYTSTQPGFEQVPSYNGYYGNGSGRRRHRRWLLGKRRKAD